MLVMYYGVFVLNGVFDLLLCKLNYMVGDVMIFYYD